MPSQSSFGKSFIEPLGTQDLVEPSSLEMARKFSKVKIDRSNSKTK